MAHSENIISKIKLPNNITYDLHDAEAVHSAVNGLQLLDQSYAYKGKLSISIECSQAVVQTGFTESEIFALEGNRYGKLFLASDTNKYWRRKDTSAEAASSHWRNDTTAVLNSQALPNQLTTEDYIYVRINTGNSYYSQLPKFFITASYDNISGSTQIIGFCRKQNKFEFLACSYNGNNLVGVYQPSANTNIYVFKFTKYRSSYGATATYNAPITIYYNFCSDTPTIEFISASHADYNTVKGYNYVSSPEFGVKFDTNVVGALSAITRSNTTSTASPALGGTFTAIDSVTSNSYGQITAVNTKTVTLPNITIPTKNSWNYDDRYARYDASQSLTSAQMLQARTNIGAGTSNFTGYTSETKLDSSYISWPSTTAQHTVFAGPTSTATGTPTFRELGANDITSGTFDVARIPSLTKSKISDFPVNLSAFTNDSGFITKSVNDLTNYTLSSALATVATSGSYNDLTNKPTIPIKTSDLVNDGSDNTAQYLETDETSYRTASIPYGEVDSTSTATAFTATIPGVTELRNGVCIYLKNGVITSAAASTAPKTFTLNVNGLGAKPVYSSMAAATLQTTQFNINYTMMFIYNSSRVSGGCWDMFYGYDTNTNTVGYQIRTNSQSLPMKSVVYRYRLLFTSADGSGFVPANNSTSTNATTARTPSQEKINPFGSIFYYGTTASVAANATPATGYLWQQYNITLGYSFANGAALTLDTYKPVYLILNPQNDGSAIIENTALPFTQALPSTADGKIYLLLGIATSAAAVELLLSHPIYYYKNGQIRLWSNAEGLPTLAAVATSGSYNDLTDKPSIPTSATATPLVDGVGAVGTSTKYALEDHVHPTDTSRAPASHTHTVSNITDFPTIPTALSDLTDDATHRLVTDINIAIWQAKAEKEFKTGMLLTNTWTDNQDGTYSKTYDFSSVYTLTANSKIDLQPNATVINQMITDGCKALYTQNDNGICTVVAVGAPLTTIITVQCTIQEVRA